MSCDPSLAGLPNRTWMVASGTASPFESMRKLYDTFASPPTCGIFVANGRSGPGPLPMSAADARPLTFMIRTVLRALAGDWNA